MGLDLDRLLQKMSNRLVADADLLGRNAPFRCVADVGCDHGYVSMYLVMRGIAERAIAMDVRKGPLSAARANVSEFGLEDKVELRISDGLLSLAPGQADALVIAGMGGRLMISILEAADTEGLGIKMGVLQPQSDLRQFREYVRKRGYEITDERIVFEDGKYYFPMLVDFSNRSGDHSSRVLELEGMIKDRLEDTEDSGETAFRLSDRYGIFNILRHDELLYDYLRHGREVNTSILAGLNRDEHSARYSEVSSELQDTELLLNM